MVEEKQNLTSFLHCVYGKAKEVYSRYKGTTTQDVMLAQFSKLKVITLRTLIWPEPVSSD